MTLGPLHAPGVERVEKIDLHRCWLTFRHDFTGKESRELPPTNIRVEKVFNERHLMVVEAAEDWVDLFRGNKLLVLCKNPKPFRVDRLVLGERDALTEGFEATDGMTIAEPIAGWRMAPARMHVSCRARRTESFVVLVEGECSLTEKGKKELLELEAR